VDKRFRRPREIPSRVFPLKSNCPLNVVAAISFRSGSSLFSRQEIDGRHFLNCTENTELTQHAFPRTFCFALNKFLHAEVMKRSDEKWTVKTRGRVVEGKTKKQKEKKRRIEVM
jgi:hypothetical protein